MSVFPNVIDSDLEIPRIENDVSEIGPDAINALRDATFAIQKTIGINPQGNKATFTDRMNVSIDANGNVKRGALENIGLLALPVIDQHVGTTAGIQESKLALDYGTIVLKNLIDSMRTDVDGIFSGLASTIATLNSHILGDSNYHDGYHIKINLASQIGIAGMEATTVGDALNEFGTRLLSGNNNITPHIDLNIPSGVKHRASEISVDASDFVTIDRTSQNVQEAFDSLDEQSGVLGITHIDKFHANGVLKEVNSGTYYNSDRRLLAPTSGIVYTEGTGIIRIPGLTSSFAALGITTGDILIIAAQTGVLDAGTYQIRTLGPLDDGYTLGGLPSLTADELAIFHTFVESKVEADLVSASIFKPAAVSSQYAPLACAVRNNETLVDTVSVLNPDAAHVVSVGFNGAILIADGYEIGAKVGIGNQEYREIIIPGLHFERLGTNRANPVNSESVAERINAFVSDPDLNHHFPITAYRIGNELAIAHNLVGSDYTIELKDGYTGSFPLGLDAYGADVLGSEIVGNSSSTYTVNGIALSTLNTVFSGYASITTNSDTFMLYDSDDQVINPLQYGIGPGSVMHVTGHPTSDTNGSYTLFTSNTTSVSLFNPEIIDAPDATTIFNVAFTNSNVPLSMLENTETGMGLMQIFVDSTGKTFAHQRLVYDTNLGSGVEIINVSDSFPVGDVSVLVGLDGDFIDFNIIYDTIPGPTVRIHEEFDGSFKLYHSNGLDYLNINIMAGTIPGGIEIVTVNDPVPSDQALLLCTTHFNGTLSITNLVDERLFGSLSTNQVRDDFIEVFSQKPVSDLRSNGVVRGLDLMDILYIDSVTSMQAVPLAGGIVYINGVRIAVETQKVIVQSYDEDGELINGDKIIGINDFGSLQVVEDDLGEILTDGYNSSSAFGKILPLYRVTINSGNIGDVIDVRRFINNLDDKMDMIVDESNNVVGNFRSLEGALLYAEKYPGEERLIIRIINSVVPVNAITVPRGVSIIGDSPYGGNGKHQILNNVNRNQSFITLAGDNRLENIEIVSSTSGLQGSLVAVSGGNVDIEKCKLQFGDTISSNSDDIGITVNARSNVRIVNNKIDNTFTGVSSELGCDDLVISNNKITGVSGIGVSCGIKIGSTSNSTTNTSITDNIIEISNVSSTDLRGIYIDIDNTIDTMRIVGNKINGGLNIISENYLSNGVRITNSADSGNLITQLIMTDNYITNVKLHDDSVYAIYIGDVDRAILGNNTIVNAGVYDVNYTSIAYIWIDDAVNVIEINNNVLSDGEVRNGIYVKNSSTLVSILDNTLKNVGETSANYIYGTSHRANVSGNKLIGSGNYGIWWKGAQSKIANNHLSSSAPSTDYAFKTAILAQNSYIDVENNTIIDMTDEASIGIANASTANNGIKVTGNTIIGDTMAKLINLTGDYHVVSGNRLRNDSRAAAGETYFIYLATNSDSVSILGNTFMGENSVGAIATSFIYSPGKVTNVSVINNIMLDAANSSMLTSGPIMFANTDVEDCIIMGNRIPNSTLYTTESVIGVTPSVSVYNNNIFGINRGMLDTRSIHACEGITAYEQIPTDGYAGVPHWVFKDGGDYWQINRSASGDTRYLYFPISGIPNGSRLKSAELQGKNVVQTGDTFEAQIFKRSIKTTGLTVTAVSDAKDMAPASGEFGNTSDTGLMDESGGSEISEVVNFKESTYYVRIKHAKSLPTSPSDIRIYGMTVSFRY